MILSGCTSIGTYDYNLSYTDKEIPIFAKTQQKINISLPRHIGYEWVTSLYDKNVVLFTDQKSWSSRIDNNTTKYTAFIFTTIKEGQTIINLIEINVITKQTVDMFSIFVKVEE